MSHLNAVERAVGYPASSAKLSLSLNIFGFWWKPSFVHRKSLTEQARANGEAIWWARWAWFEVSYSRWV